MTRNVGDLPEPITIRVADSDGSPLAGVTVTVLLNGGAATVYSEPTLTTVLTPVVTDGQGVASFYGSAGLYTFTTNSPDAAPIEPVQLFTAAAPVASGVPSTRTISTTNGLQGGGDLSANRTLSPTYGTAANTFTQGNDARVIASAAATLTRTAVKTAATYTAAVGDLVPVDTTSNSVTVTLPTAPADRSRVAVKQIIRGGTNTVTYACAGADVINRAGGATSGTLTLAGHAVLLQYDSATAIWTVLADDVPLPQLDLRYDAVSTVRGWRVTSKVATYTAVTGDLVLANGTFTVTLPAPAAGVVVTVKNSGSGVVTVAPPGAVKIDGTNASITLAALVSRDFVTDGTDYWVT